MVKATKNGAKMNTKNTNMFSIQVCGWTEKWKDKANYCQHRGSFILVTLLMVSRAAMEPENGLTEMFTKETSSMVSNKVRESLNAKMGDGLTKESGNKEK